MTYQDSHKCVEDTMSSHNIKLKNNLRKKIQQDISIFIKNGGSIDHVEYCNDVADIPISKPNYGRRSISQDPFDS